MSQGGALPCSWDGMHEVLPASSHSLSSSGSLAVPLAKSKGSLAPRAQRFMVELPIKFRELGTEPWHEGSTLSVSASGVLFQAPNALLPETPIEVAVTLPAVLPGRPSAEIVGRGTVARSACATGAAGIAVLGASIQQFRFVRHHDNGSDEDGGPANPVVG